jgi:methionyl aminopeptidase
LHAPPYVSNVMPEYGTSWTEATMRCEPGTLIAVEPMIAIGTGEIRGVNHDKWPILTADGSMSVHYEHDVLITEDGPRVLTEGLDNLPDVIG